MGRASYASRVVLLTLVVPAGVVAASVVCAVVCARRGRAVWRRWLVHLLVAALAVAALLAFVYYGWAEDWQRFGRVTRWGCAPRAFAEGLADCVPVGGGWSFLLNKRAPAPGARVVYTHKWRGQLPDGWWGAGTTIAEAQRVFRAHSRTLASHPSIPTATLGGWIFTGSHGSGGDLWLPTLGAVRVFDARTGEVQTGRKRDYFRATRPLAEQRRYIILAVELKPRSDVWVEQRAFRVCTLRDARRCVRTPSYLRLVTVGARGALALLWTPPRTPGLADASWSQGTLGRWLQADALALYQRPRRGCDADDAWFAWPLEPPEAWHCRVRLSEANLFTPLPYGYLQALALLYVNFELFYDVGELSPTLLLAVLGALERAFVETAGRCEVRFGGGRLYLDVAVAQRAGAVARVCAAIHAALPGRKATLHKGKAQVDVRPIARAERP